MIGRAAKAGAAGTAANARRAGDAAQDAQSLKDARAMGLSDAEWELVNKRLGRAPNLCELGIFSAMWSEHCSYKSSKKHLAALPTKGPQVIHGPGENAGVVDIGDGLAAVFKIESHNHPSFIEPYQGAATGVGGILRDVFTMGARPVALLNALRFGAADHKTTRHLLSGVVRGIGGYGNCIGVPTIGGEVNFDASYNANILVNAMAVGIANSDRIFTAVASGTDNPVIYVGAKTGRDGIHGATMASAEFSGADKSKRPTVQVGDPFTGKLLMEACLELMAMDAVVAIQDMGAAGLTSSAVEMASKGGLGIEMNLDLVPVREDAMSAYEIMLSESQERMLMVITPETAETAHHIFEKWGLDFMPIGKVTDTGRLVLLKDGGTACDIPLAPLVDDAPVLDRPQGKSPKTRRVDSDVISRGIKSGGGKGGKSGKGGGSGKAGGIGGALCQMMVDERLASRRWVYEQYDSQVMADTFAGPGGDAGVVRVRGTKKGLAATTDCTPRYVEADARLGAMQAVAEAWRNICCVGARGLAVTNNLNFGNPEKPEIMAQLANAIAGIGEAAEGLGTPVVSGNVSLYNETDGRAIKPCPVIGMIGVIDDLDGLAGIAPGAGDALVVIGQDGARDDGHLGVSLLAEILGDAAAIEKAGPAAPPDVDLKAERLHGEFVRERASSGMIGAAHDISDGGLAVAVAEMCLAGRVGARVDLPKGGDRLGWAFGEDQARYVVATDRCDALLKAAAKAGVPAARVGEFSDGDELHFGDESAISVGELRRVWEDAIPRLMQAG